MTPKFESPAPKRPVNRYRYKRQIGYPYGAVVSWSPITVGITVGITVHYGDTLLNPFSRVLALGIWLRAAPPGPRIATGRRGKAIEKSRRAERTADRLAPAQRGDRRLALLGYRFALIRVFSKLSP